VAPCPLAARAVSAETHGWPAGAALTPCSSPAGSALFGSEVGDKLLTRSLTPSTAATASLCSSPLSRCRPEQGAPASSALLRCCELLEGLADRFEDDDPAAEEALLRTDAARTALRSALAQAKELARPAQEFLDADREPTTPMGRSRRQSAELTKAAEAALRATRDRLAASIEEARKSGVPEVELRPAERQRREMHSLIQDLRGLVRIYCRVRPLNARERRGGEEEVLSVAGGTSVEVVGCSSGPFAFDAVFPAEATQEQIFEEARDLAQSALDGHNVTVLTYGQTGTGKSYTMYGAPGDDGLAVRMVRDLFDRIGSRRISVTGSLVEMHNNRLVDLLDGPDRAHSRSALSLRRRDPDGDEVHIDGAVEWPLRSAAELLDLVKLGTSRRAVAAHALNSESSRSHAFLTVRVLSAVGGPAGTGVDSKILFCDLAGSERLKRSEVTGEHVKEAIDTNCSLSALGNVIEAIVHRQRHIPYRNHKLTQLLQDSLGGSAKALIFATCSPASGSAHETSMALKFVSRATRVANTFAGSARP